MLSEEAVIMATRSIPAAPGYQFETFPDLSQLETRKRLSQSAMDGFFAVTGKWKLNMVSAGAVFGGLLSILVNNPVEMIVRGFYSV